MEEKPKTTITAARSLESDKTSMERGEDIAYTINHAISCGLTDLGIQPYVGAWVIDKTEHAKFPKQFKWLQKIFEAHNHDEAECKTPGHNHAHSKAPGFWTNVGHYLQAEVYGDVGAVPATILVQRFAPGFMNSIRDGLEPMVGGAFKDGAHKASIHWAERNGYNIGSAEQIGKEHELYEYEMKHLPQAVMWNAFAWPSNVLLQRYVFKEPGHEHRLASIALGKTFGAFFSNTALLGWRAVSPDTAHQWDQWNSEHIITPVTKTIGGVLGVDNETSERIARQHAESEGHGWKKREESKRVDQEAPAIAAVR